MLAFKSSLIVTLLPSSVIAESAKVFAPVKRGITLVVPLLLVVTVFGLPPQLLSVCRQTVSLLPPAMLGKVYVALPVPLGAAT